MVCINEYIPNMINFISYFVFCSTQPVQIMIKEFKEHSTFVLKFYVNIKNSPP